MTRHAAICLVVAATLLASPGMAAAQTNEQEPEPAYQKVEPVKKLRLMLLDLADLKEPKADDAFVPPEREYTHTFGSQRKSAEELPQLAVNPEGLEADVVVLHGVADTKSVRRLFPARDWRLLISRSPALQDVKSNKSNAAIALWLQPGVRYGGVDMTAPPGLGATLRLTSGLGTLWVLSPTEACTSAAGAPGALCKPLEDWVTTKLAAGDIVLVGGVLPPITRTESKAGSVPEAAIPVKLARAGATPITARRHTGVIQLTAADAAGRCGGEAQANSALYLRLAKDDPASITWSGYRLPLAPEKSSSPGAKESLAPHPPACALLLDIDAVQ